jgi:hypothetical protein
MISMNAVMTTTDTTPTAAKPAPGNDDADAACNGCNIKMPTTTSMKPQRGALAAISERQRALLWLRCMEIFCVELNDFVNRHVPLHCDPWEYTEIPAALVQHHVDYPHIVAVCQEHAGASVLPPSTLVPAERSIVREYMTGIPSDDDECRTGIERVQSLGMQTFASISVHPSLGVFRCSESKGLETRPLSKSSQYFFERGLNMCLALGTEHTWMQLKPVASRFVQ